MREVQARDKTFQILSGHIIVKQKELYYLRKTHSFIHWFTQQTLNDTFLGSVIEGVNKIVSASMERKFYNPDWEEHWGQETVYMEAENISRRLRKEEDQK